MSQFSSVQLLDTAIQCRQLNRQCTLFQFHQLTKSNWQGM